MTVEWGYRLRPLVPVPADFPPEQAAEDRRSRERFLAAVARIAIASFPLTENAAWVDRVVMSVPGADQLGERPLEEMVQRASHQAVVLAREQVDAAVRDLATRAGKAGPAAAMVGGGALLAALASGTGTAALILALAGRRGASAAALGVTGAYAGAGALLARGGLVRLREAGTHLPDVSGQDEPAHDAEQEVKSVKRQTKTAAKSARRTKSAAESLPRPTGRPKPRSKTASSRRRAPDTQTRRTRRRGS